MMNQNELYHYGVLGMKWGHRKRKVAPENLSDSKKRRISKKYKKYSKKAFNDVAKRKDQILSEANRRADDFLNKEGGIDKFNNEKEKKYGKKYFETEKYIDEFIDYANGIYDKYQSLTLKEALDNYKNYKKSVALVNKYGMVKWDDLARANEKNVF